LVLTEFTIVSLVHNSKYYYLKFQRKQTDIDEDSS